MGPKPKRVNAHTIKKEKRSKCPNKTHKNAQGDCVFTTEEKSLNQPTSDVDFSVQDSPTPMINDSTDEYIADTTITNILNRSPPNLYAIRNNSVDQQNEKTRKTRNKYCPKGSRRIRGVCVRKIDNVIVNEIESTPPTGQEFVANVNKTVRKSRGKSKGVINADVSSSENQLGNRATNLDAVQVTEFPNIDQFNNATMVEDDTCKNRRTDVNAFLAEKERIEYAEYTKRPISTDDPKYSLYPDINDPLFSSQIAKRKEFQETKYDDEIYDLSLIHI